MSDITLGRLSSGAATDGWYATIQGDLCGRFVTWEWTFDPEDPDVPRVFGPLVIATGSRVAVNPRPDGWMTPGVLTLTPTLHCGDEPPVILDPIYLTLTADGGYSSAPSAPGAPLDVLSACRADWYGNCISERVYGTYFSTSLAESDIIVIFPALGSGAAPDITNFNAFTVPYQFYDYDLDALIIQLGWMDGQRPIGWFDVECDGCPPMRVELT